MKTMMKMGTMIFWGGIVRCLGRGCCYRLGSYDATGATGDCRDGVSFSGGSGESGGVLGAAARGEGCDHGGAGGEEECGAVSSCECGGAGEGGEQGGRVCGA